MVLVVTGASLAVMAGLMSWSASYDQFSQRGYQYYKALGAAEAASEKVVGLISRDFQQGGEPQVRGNLSVYQTSVPTSAESSIWSSYEFRDNSGTVNRTYVARLSDWQYNYLESKYTGLLAMASLYRIVATARELNAPYNIAAAVQQDVQIASIPLYQFGVFYSSDLEICPSTSLTLSGRIHSNGSIYTQPTGTLNLSDSVTAARQVLQQKGPNDPTTRTPGPVNFLRDHDSGTASLNIPIGTSNDPTNLHALIDLPPGGEDPNSALGKQRFFNKADMIVLVTDSGIVGSSGRYNNFVIGVTNLEVKGVIKRTASFFDKRAALTIQATELDINKLRTEYSNLTSQLGREPKTIYMIDARSQSATIQNGVRLINGVTLPTQGLTVATPNRLYIKGHYNSPSATRGTSSTAGTAPSAVAGDALTILSTVWTDPGGGNALSARIGASTTVNTAVIAGIVPSGNGYYSGGLENFFRFLEDWTGKIFTFNGSISSLFYCQIATAPWGAATDIYLPPTRAFTFDNNFLDVTKLPPSTPEVRLVVRKQWVTAQANSTGTGDVGSPPPGVPAGANPF